jgi:hypothetical protein
VLQKYLKTVHPRLVNPLVTFFADENEMNLFIIVRIRVSPLDGSPALTAEFAELSIRSGSYSIEEQVNQSAKSIVASGNRIEDAVCINVA